MCKCEYCAHHTNKYANKYAYICVRKLVLKSASECATAAMSHFISHDGTWHGERDHQNNLTADGAVLLGFMCALVCCFN